MKGIKAKYMIKNDKKRTFTLIELLVVIAILAVLATVAIVSYGVFTKKAKESNDIYLVKQMNIVLEASEVLDGKNKTMTDALEDVFDRGYDVTKLTPTSSNYNIVWDSINDRMVLLNDQREIVFPKENMSANKDLFVMISSESDMKKFVGYSYYLRSDFLTDSNAITINNGLDVGNNENITSVSYEHTTGEKQTSIIRTIKGSLVINGLNGDEGDTIKHYGFISNLSINSIGNKDCYHEFGFVGSVELFSSGKFIAEKTSIFHQTKDAVEGVVAANNIDRFFESKIGAQYDEHYFENGKCVICDADKCIHKWDDGTISKEPTCTVVGTKVYKCELCGKERDEEISAKGHTIVVDEKKEPTCTETGLTKGEHCSECGTIITKQDTLSALNHDWDEVKYEWSRDYKTCTAKRICKRDNNHIETEMVTTKQTITQNQATCDIEEISKFTATFENASFIEQVKDNIVTKAKGTHTFSWVIDKDSTCKETGLKHEECGICHYKQNENTVVDKKAHTEVIDNAVEATCTSTGLTEGKHCSECNEIIVKQNEIPMKEHDWNEGQIIIQPTCNTTGEELFTCKNCNATKKETLSKTNDHDWNEWVDFDSSTHERTCSICNANEYENHDTNGTNNICSKCGHSSAKNGLIDGIYYADDVPYTGMVDNYNFVDGMLVFYEIKNESTISSETNNGMRFSNQSYNFDSIPDKYKTSNIKILLDDISATNYNITSKDYKITSAKAYAPMKNLLTKIGWSNDDIAILVNSKAKNQFVSKNNAGNFYYSYPSDIFNEYKMYLPYINLTNDFEAYLKLLGYTFIDTTVDHCIEEYLELYEANKLPLTYNEYLKLKYIQNNTVTEIINNNGNFEYKCAGIDSYIYDINNRKVSTTFASDNPGQKNSPAFSIEISSDGDFVLGQCGYMNGDATNDGLVKIIKNSEGKWEFSESSNSSSFWWDTNTSDGSGKNLTTNNHIELHSITLKDENAKEYQYVGRKLVIEITYNNTIKAWYTTKEYTNSNEVIVNIGEYALYPESGENILTDISNLVNYNYTNYTNEAKEIINNSFNTGANNKHITYVHCENEVIELYYKMMVKCSGVKINDTVSYFDQNGEIDITSALSSLNGTINAYYPASQGSDLVYPSVEIILSSV